jgi:hypothetical protein
MIYWHPVTRGELILRHHSTDVVFIIGFVFVIQANPDSYLTPTLCLSTHPSVMLMSAVSAGARAATVHEEDGITPHAESALSAFSFFLFILYLAFVYFAYRWRELILNYDNDQFDVEEYANDDGNITDDDAAGDVELASAQKKTTVGHDSDDVTVAEV